MPIVDPMQQILRPPLASRQGRIHFAGVDLCALVREHGTPTYVTDRATLERNYSNLRAGLDRTNSRSRIYVAAKANPGLYEFMALERLGAFFEASSIGEMGLGLDAGFSSSRMRFTSVAARLDEYATAALHVPSIPITFDAPMDRVRSVLTNLVPQLHGRPLEIGFRVNPGIGLGLTEGLTTAGEHYIKFGIRGKLADYLKLVKPLGGKVFVHAHLGTGGDQNKITSVYAEALCNLIDITRTAEAESGVNVYAYCIGGGYPAVYPYVESEQPFDMSAFLSALTETFKEKLSIRDGDVNAPFLDIEPGRRIFATAILLLSQVMYVNRNPDGSQDVYVDTGFNQLVRPAMYGAYHQILVANKPDDEAAVRTTVYGNLCESGDKFGDSYMLPPLETGDVLVAMHYGAYGVSMASTYTGRPLPLGLAIDAGNVVVTRTREEARHVLTRDQLSLASLWKL